jgi:pSer/pThr/pTyr-binding forkhead associated (FHA) protein
VPDTLLAVLKVIFLGLLYLFFVRVLRAVWIELREPKTVEAAAVPPPRPHQPQSAQSQPQPQPSRKRGRAAKARGDRLVVVEPAGRKGQVFALGDELTVGRAAGCGVTIPDDTFVSQMHARVFRRDGSLYVEDLGSTNGTFLNKKPVSAALQLRKGDRLQVGKTVLELSR